MQDSKETLQTEVRRKLDGVGLNAAKTAEFNSMGAEAHVRGQTAVSPGFLAQSDRLSERLACRVPLRDRRSSRSTDVSASSSARRWLRDFAALVWLLAPWTLATAQDNLPPSAVANGPYSAVVGAPISFSSAGSNDPDGSIDDFNWNFGDGSSASGRNPNHAYDGAGTYTATLTVTDDDGATASATATVTITEPPNAPPDADANGPYSGTVGAPVAFSSAGSNDPDGSIDDFNWNFGDGSSSSGRNPNHAYDGAGTYTATLTVTDDDGATASATATVTITEAPNEPPTADAGGPYSGTIDEAIRFSGDDSTDQDGRIDDYAWDFGDGNADTGRRPRHAYAAAGTYTVTLTVTDDDGATDSATATVTIDEPENEPPEPDANGPYAGTVGESVSFSSAGSSDPDGSIDDFQWSFGDGDSSSARNPSHSYDEAGSYTVTLTVTDDDGATASASAAVTIDEPPNEPPEPDANGPYSGTAGEPVSFSSAGSSDPDGSIEDYDWSFGDGRRSSGRNPSHSYDEAGSYTVTLTVTDDDGATASATASVTIEEPPNEPPSARNDSYRTDEDVPLRIGTSSGVLANDSDPNGDDLAAELVDNVADGELSLERDGGFVYRPGGDFSGSVTFSYRAFDGEYSSGTATVTIEVTPTNDPPAGDIPDQTGTENLPLAAPLDLGALFSDPEGDAMTFTVTGLPPGLSASTGGLISGAPVLDESAGDWSIEVVVTDAGNPPATISREFTWRVLPAGHADLALGVTVAPRTALTTASATWTYTITNSSQEDVGNIALAAEFSGARFAFTDLTPGCTPQAADGATVVDCRLGPLPAGQTLAVTMIGSGPDAGDVFTTGFVRIADPIPIDYAADNDTASGTLGLTGSIDSTAAQTISAPGQLAGAPADFNGDGLMDLAIATDAQSPVLIYVGRPDPDNPVKRAIVESPATAGVSGITLAIAAADFDGDGFPDLVTAGGPGGMSELLINGTGDDGAISFVAGQALDIGAAFDVAVGDIDGDGGPEAVFAARAGNSIVAYAGGVLTHTLLPGTSDGRAVTLANLSGDALPEIVSVEADGNALIYPNTGGTFPTPVTLPVGGATSVTAADFDGDGDVDLAFGVGSFGAARKLPANAVFENVSSAAGPEFVRVGDLGASETIAIVTDDVDGNGAADLIAVNASGSHKVYMNDGAGTFAELAHRFETNGAVAVAIGAVGPDSRADVIVTGPDGTSIFYNDGSGNFGLGDTEAPIITLLGPVTMEILVESAFEDPGATAMDGADGDLTSFIIVENPVDPAIVGEQTVTYTVTDSSGNVAAPVTRRVRVLVAEAVGGGGGGAFGPGLLVLVLVTQLCAVARWCRPLPGRAPLRRPPADSGHSRHRYR